MKCDLYYVAPVRSTLGEYKHNGGRRILFNVRRTELKQLGTIAAHSGVLKGGAANIIPLKVAALAQDISGNTALSSHIPDPVHIFDDLLRKYYPVFVACLERDRVKIETGVWAPVMWANESWWLDSPYALVHSLHVSENDAGRIAFAESPEKLMADRYIVMKPGRYLSRFFGESLSEATIKYWAERQAARGCPTELKFVEGTDADKDEWVRVYRVGPKSCMQGEDTVSVYAHDHSVLRLAYMQQGEEIVARSIVREDRKEYIRCYPSPNNAELTRLHTAMVAALEAAGYSHGDLDKVYLDKVPVDGSRFMMPYLDGCNYTHVTEVRVSGQDLWRVGDHGIDAQTQEGYVDINPTRCDDCNDRMSEEEACYVESHDRTVCNHCLSHNYVCAIGRRGHEDYYSPDDCVEVGDQWYVIDYANDNDIYQDERSGDYYHLDDLCMTAEGYIHCDNCAGLDVDDEDGNSYAHERLVVQTHDGRTIMRCESVCVDGEVFHQDDEEVKEEKEIA